MGRIIGHKDSVPAALTSNGLTLLSSDDRAVIAFKGVEGDARVFYYIYGPNAWQPAPSIVTGGFTSTIAALEFADDSILIAFKGVEGDRQIY
jgi:hypothetical protein